MTRLWAISHYSVASTFPAGTRPAATRSRSIACAGTSTTQMRVRTEQDHAARADGKPRRRDDTTTRRDPGKDEATEIAGAALARVERYRSGITRSADREQGTATFSPHGQGKR
jgi:hypothetical protein